MRAIESMLKEAADNVTQQSLTATLRGIEISTGAGISGARAIAHATLGQVLEAGAVNAMYGALNQRAVLAFSTRRRFDGLRLSDRVWKIGGEYRTQIGRAIEHGISRGLDSRKLARELDQHLNPRVSSPHSPAVRSRLGISRDVSYQSMRLARTEMSNAFREGTVLGHRATPSYEGSIWEISGSHPVMDECDDLAVGENGFGFYSAGNEPLAPHPNCMCVLSPVHKDPEEFTRDLERWLDDPGSSPELESWYNETARPLLGEMPLKPLSAPARVPATIGAAPRPTVSAGAGKAAPTTRALTQAITAPTQRQSMSLGSKAQQTADDAIETITAEAPAAASSIPEQYRAALERVRTARRSIDEALDVHNESAGELLESMLELGRTARVELKSRLGKIKGHKALEKKLTEASRAERAVDHELTRLAGELKRYTRGSPEWTDIARKFNAQINVRDLAEKEVIKLAKKISPVRQRVIRQIVGEVREMGGSSSIDDLYRLRVSSRSVAGATDDVNNALDLFPREWLEQSAARRGQLTIRTASSQQLKGALGGYADVFQTVMYRGSGFERFNTILHELGHRMQYSVGRYTYARPGGSDAFGSIFTKIEDAFRSYRAAGEVPSTHAGYGAKDWIADRFVDDYFGVLNGSGKSEMFTRGLESLYNGRWAIYEEDEEMLDYMLGLLMGL